jgi:hypothetical protein
MIPITEPPSIVTEYVQKFRAFFSKPQFDHFVNYITGLIVSTNKTVQGINDSFMNHKDQSALNNFITDSGWDETQVNDRRIELCKEQLAETPEKDSCLIIDDTLSHKTGEHIEQAELHFDHSTNQYQLGHQVVTSLLVARDKKIPLDLRLYKRYHDDDPDFKTKIQLALELLRDAVTKQIPFGCVIFDAWYLSQEVTKTIAALHKFWISPLKSNRSIVKHNNTIKLETYIATIPKSSFKKKTIKGTVYWYYAEIVTITNLGKIYLVAFHETPDCSDIVTVLGSSAVIWTPDKIIDSFKQRWSIETFYKDSKQNLGFEDYELRKLNGIIRHWYLVFLAYTLLQLSATNKSLTKWFNSNLKTVGDHCRFAMQETIKYFILYVLKIYQTCHDEEKIITLIFNPKADFRFSFK